MSEKLREVVHIVAFDSPLHGLEVFFFVVTLCSIDRANLELRVKIATCQLLHKPFQLLAALNIVNVPFKDDALPDET